MQRCGDADLPGFRSSAYIQGTAQLAFLCATKIRCAGGAHVEIARRGMRYYEPMKTLKLYPFPMSHYCEKARWALDYKSLDYQRHNLVPGAHCRTVGKYAAGSSVPPLVAGDRVAHGSARIITLLDDLAPEVIRTSAARPWPGSSGSPIGTGAAAG